MRKKADIQLFLIWHFEAILWAQVISLLFKHSSDWTLEKKMNSFMECIFVLIKWTEFFTRVRKLPIKNLINEVNDQFWQQIVGLRDHMNWSSATEDNGAGYIARMENQAQYYFWMGAEASLYLLLEFNWKLNLSYHFEGNNKTNNKKSK